MGVSGDSSSGGIGFFGMLTIVFIVLKLTGYITWSWFWVLSPLFVLPVVLIVTFVVAAVMEKFLD